MSNVPGLRSVSLIVTLAAGTAGARCGYAPEAKQPLPPVTKVTVDTLQNPFRQVAPGVYARSLYQARPLPDLRIDVQDFEIASGTSRASVAFPGTALLQIRSGRLGTAMVADTANPFQVGGILRVSQGDSLVLTNVGARISMRAYVFVGTGGQ
jgi:hypothetical protein